MNKNKSLFLYIFFFILGIILTLFINNLLLDNNLKDNNLKDNNLNISSFSGFEKKVILRESMYEDKFISKISSYTGTLDGYINLFSSYFYEDRNALKNISRFVTGGHSLNINIFGKDKEIYKDIIGYNYSETKAYTVGYFLSYFIEEYKNNHIFCKNYFSGIPNIKQYFYNEKNIYYSNIVNFPISRGQFLSFVEGILFMKSLKTQDYEGMKDFCINNKNNFCGDEVKNMFIKDDKISLISNLKNNRTKSYINIYALNILEPMSDDLFINNICSEEINRYKYEKN